MIKKVSVKKLLELMKKYNLLDYDDVFVGNGNINILSSDETQMWEFSYDSWGLYFDENGFLEEHDEEDNDYDHISVCHMVRDEKDGGYYCQELFEEIIE